MTTVVLVEDSSMHRKLYGAWLEVGGHAVIMGADERHAIDRIEQARPDLIIMDIRLPHLSGLGLIEACKQRTSIAHIPVLALTVCDSAQDEADCLTAGADAYLAKSVTMSNFLDVVGALTTVEGPEPGALSLEDVSVFTSDCAVTLLPRRRFFKFSDARVVTRPAHMRRSFTSGCSSLRA